MSLLSFRKNDNLSRIILGSAKRGVLQVEQTKVFSAVNGWVTRTQTLEDAMNAFFKEMGNTIEVTQKLAVASGRLDQHVTVIIFYKMKTQD